LFSNTTISTWSGRLGVVTVGDAGVEATGLGIGDVVVVGDAAGVAAQPASARIAEAVMRIRHRTHPP
jgi:hypothetical protein